MVPTIPIDKGYRKFFKDMDFFSITFQFRVANNAKFSSFCGGVTSLFYIILMITYLTISVFDYISFQDYKIQFIERYNDNTTLYLNQSNFFYSFVFTYIDTNGEDNNEYPVIGTEYENLFEIEHNYVVIDRSLKIKNKQKIPIRNCSEVDIEDYQTLNIDEKGEIEKPLDLNDHICFDYPNMPLYGRNTYQKLSYVEVILKLKNESLNEKNINKTVEILNNVIFKFAPHYTDHIYDVSNLKVPVTKRVDSTVYSYVDQFYFERVNIFFQHLKFSQDKNLIYKEPDPVNYLKFSSYKKYISPMFMRMDPNSKFSEKLNFVKYYLRASMKENEVNVILMKIP